MKKLAGWFTLSFLAVILSAQTLTAQDAEVYVVHGIPGVDLGLPGDLPVDIAVDGNCTFTDFRFGSWVGPVPLPAGTYRIEISTANAANPCSNPAVIDVTVTLAAGEKATIIAHLTDTGAATASKFTNDLSPANGDARLIIHHAANAPAVDALLAKFGPASQFLSANGVVNADQLSLNVPPGLWGVGLTPAGVRQLVLGPAVGLACLIQPTSFTSWDRWRITHWDLLSSKFQSKDGCYGESRFITQKKACVRKLRMQALFNIP